MRSPGNSPRAWLEGLLHALAVGLLAVAALAAWREQSRGGADERVRSAGLAAALARWSTAAAPVAVEADLRHAPTVVERDWLAALPGAGTGVRWFGTELTATAMSVLPSADPQRAATLMVAAPAGSPVITGDVRRDTAQAIGGLLRLNLPQPGAETSVEIAGLAARPAITDSLGLRRILILGRAGWETKFAMAALEERGWQVDVHLALAPGGDVVQGLKAGVSAPAEPVVQAPASPSPAPVGRTFSSFAQRAAALAETRSPVVSTPAAAIPIDTSRYSAVLALDSTAAREGARIVRFVRSGGGLLLWPEAASIPALQAIAPAQNRPADSDLDRRGNGIVTLDSLPLRALVSLKLDAIVLSRRGLEVTLAAHRVGPGRVMQLGLDELWRWRMSGPPDAAAAHRAWLARAVAGVAHAPRQGLDVIPGDAAPYAALVDRLGGPVPASLPLAAAFSGLLNVWTFILLSAALLTEWLSRRLRSRP